MTVAQRIKKTIEKLGISQNKFAQEIGVPQPTVNAIFNRNKDVSGAILNAIVIRYDVNPDWLITGRGEMFINAEKVDVTHNFGSGDKMEGVSIVPVFPNYMQVSAGFNPITDPIILEQANKFVLPNMPKCDGAIQVSGDSMYPLLKAGDYVAFRMIENSIDYISFGNIYIVDYEYGGDDVLSVKFVHKSEKGGDYIKLVSYNEHFEPIDIPFSHVRHIARVKISIRQH